MPALAIRISTGPSSRSTADTSAPGAATWDMSPANVAARRPSAWTSAATCSAASALARYAMATSCPSCAKRTAVAAPMPREPPVISATAISVTIPTPAGAGGHGRSGDCHGWEAPAFRHGQLIGQSWKRHPRRPARLGASPSSPMRSRAPRRSRGRKRWSTGASFPREGGRRSAVPEYARGRWSRSCRARWSEDGRVRPQLDFFEHGEAGPDTVFALTYNCAQRFAVGRKGICPR
jgi:hypothetical protein